MFLLIVVLSALQTQASPYHCGGYGEERPSALSGEAGYTMTDIELWPSSVIIPYSFVSNGDCFKNEAVYTDSKIGLSKEELAVIMRAMRKIEDMTCIRFKRVKPKPDQNWLLLMKEGDGHQCYISHIQHTLSNKNINGLGQIFSRWEYGTSCFPGFYTTWLGMGDPSYLVTSMVDIRDTEDIVGSYVHELFHTLGVGHTQKRPDRDSYITVNKLNILPSSLPQYEKCTRYCETHGSPYDCESIMHYRDWAFSVGHGRKTMTAKNPYSCDLSRAVTQMSNSDIKLLNKMYCNGLPASKVGYVNQELKTTPDDTICNEERKESGFIITGGLNTGAQRKAEAYNPLTGRNCPLPDLTQEMNLHSQCGQLICKERSCIKINSMGFSSSASVSLSHRRSKHLCWSQPGGEVMLLGGEYSPYSSEVISSDGSSTRANRWSLAYKTDSACGVEVGDKFVVSGGSDRYARDWALSNVVRYGRQGDVEKLPSLTIRRYYHACASYLNDKGQNILLVTGGWNNRAKYLDSTELMVDFTYWTPAARLPSPRSGLQAASLDGKIFAFGGFDGVSAKSSILTYSPDRNTWQYSGTMTTPRYDHALAVYTDLTHLCP